MVVISKTIRYDFTQLIYNVIYSLFQSNLCGTFFDQQDLFLRQDLTII